MQTKLCLLSWLVVLSTVAVSPGAATAQTTTDAQKSSAPTNQLEEVIVTAQKRAQNLQDVPLAITAISGEELKDRHVSHFDDLARVMPNVTFSNSTGEARIGIRGISFDNIGNTAAEPRVGFYLDGVYLAMTQDIPETLFDVDRFEVTRGPQGTVFGRNTVGGAISLISRNPTGSFGGYADVDVGSYNSTILNAAVNGPIAENVSARLAIHSSNRGGYGTDLSTNEDVDDLHDLALRGKVKFALNDNLTVLLSADYAHRADHTYLFYAGQASPAIPLPAAFRPGAAPNRRDIYSVPAPSERNDLYGVGANINWDLGNGLSLVSVTGYRHAWTNVTYNATFSPLNWLTDWAGTKASQFSEEVRVQKDFSRGHAMLGAYYLSQKYSSNSYVPINVALFGGPDFLTRGLQFGGSQRLNAPAVFGQASYDLTKGLELTVGARYSRDKKEKYDQYNSTIVNAPADPHGSECRQPCNLGSIPSSAHFAPATNTWSNFSPSVSLLYKLTGDTNVYFTFSKSFKSGGFNLGLDGGVQAGYQPETISDYEGGIKTQLLDRTLQVNLAAFYYDYKNLQVSKINANLTASILNAAAAKLYGVESEIVYLPTAGLRLDLSGSLMHTEYTNFQTYNPTMPGVLVDLKGNRLENAPEYTANYGAQYTFSAGPGKLTLRGEGYSAGRIYFDPYNTNTVSTPAKTVANASLAYQKGNIRASAYVRNLTDAFQLTGASVSNGLTGFPVQGSFLAPRTYGVTFRVEF